MAIRRKPAEPTSDRELITGFLNSLSNPYVGKFAKNYSFFLILERLAKKHNLHITAGGTVTFNLFPPTAKQKP